MSTASPDLPDVEPSEFVMLHDDMHALHAKLDKLIESHNAVGENIAWLVANTQGLFQMFNSPEMMGQLMGMLGGGVKPNG